VASLFPKCWASALGAAASVLIALHARAGDDIVIGDFAGTSYAPWAATGDAFPAPADQAAQQRVEITNSDGMNVATSRWDKSDGRTGTLTSPTFTIERDYISFFISGGSLQRTTCLNLLINGTVVKSAPGNNSNRLEAASLEVLAWKGRKAQVQIVDQATVGWGYINVAHVVQTDHPVRPPPIFGPLYHEALRPQFHFTARQWTVEKAAPQQREEGWMNDPNGLIYYAGEYHLFSQRWAKCWIHAVSPDLLHWTELQPAFWETEEGSGTQSGTAVIDWKNTSGLSPDPANPPFVCFWPTWDNATQNICYSLDHGRTFKPYSKNPVLRHSERDPKVFWYEPTKSWVMFLYDNDVYRIFTSPNLLEWNDTGNTVPNSHECPDVFQLPIDGDKTKLKWVLIRGNGSYSLGEFDGTKFTEETPQIPCDSGPNFYATQTWNEMPGGRRVQIAWMQGGTYPGMPFNQQMTFPRELTLRTTPAGVRLFREPIREIAQLHGAEDDWPAQTLSDGAQVNLRAVGECFHFEADVKIPEGATLTFHLCGTDLHLTHAGMECGSQAGVTGELTHLEILVDRTSIEAFANHGEASLSRCMLPTREGISLEYHGGTASITSLKIFDMRSAWKTDVAVPSAKP
jgi:sucrose-6-phosphate hydrolase SacC (GH32 family)